MDSASNSPPLGSITRCLKAWQNGDESALARLADEVYIELRRLAGAVISRQPNSPTVQATALVHDLYLRLPGVQEIDWQSRVHFLNVAAKMMRNILIDHARSRLASKRGGGALAIEINDETTGGASAQSPPKTMDVLMVNEALERFAQQYPRQARVVDLRFFGGLTVEETVEVLNATGLESSTRTVERDWTFAKAWLLQTMTQDAFKHDIRS